MLNIVSGTTGEGTVRVRPLRRAEYQHLVRAGAFDDESIELLYGALVEAHDDDPWHDRVIAAAATQLREQVGTSGRVLVQRPLALSDYSMPIPDLLVTSATSHWDGGRHRSLLAVEVAGTSVDKDRGPKRQLYGAAPIDEYWLVDLEAGCIEVFAERDPQLGVWGTSFIRRRGEIAQHAAIPHLWLSIDDLIPLPWLRRSVDTPRPRANLDADDRFTAPALAFPRDG
jgi:Uma2 family endonuclease